MAANRLIEECKQKNEFTEFIDQLLFRRFSRVQLCTGSCFELPLIYFMQNITDIDNTTYSTSICAFNKDANVPNNFKGTVLSIQSEGIHLGYARLHFKQNNKPYTFVTLPEERPAKFHVLFQKSDISTTLFSGSDFVSKCLETFQGLNRDIVEAIWCPNWPDEANEWQHRERRNGWPPEGTVNRIVNNGCLLVAKPHQGSEFIANEWRFSFSEAELFLIYTWSDVQMYIYHILRLIKSDVVRKCGGKMMTVLTTYHFKTLMLWACEENPKEFWIRDNIESSIKELILLMIEWLTEKQCRNYFIPGNNMLDHLPDSHNFEREAQFLAEAVDLVHEYIYNTPLVAGNRNNDKGKAFSVRIPTNVLYTLQLRASLWDFAYGSRLGLEMYAHQNDMSKCNLFRSDMCTMFQFLTIHRRLTLVKDMKEKLSRLHEVEQFFRNTLERNVQGFMHVDISPLDNVHDITSKLLRTNLDGTNSIQPSKSNSSMAESIGLSQDSNSRRWELCYSRTKSIQRNHVAHFMETVGMIMNKNLVKATGYFAVAYEANFYWTMFEEDRDEYLLDNLQKALAVCEKWLSCDVPIIKHCLTFKLGFNLQAIPIPISNRWSGIFDKYIQVVLGFLSIVKAITNRGYHSSCELSESNALDFDVLIQVHPRDLLGYIQYQCRFHSKDYAMLDDSFTRDMQIDISKMFLYTAARVSTDSG